MKLFFEAKNFESTLALIRIRLFKNSIFCHNVEFCMSFD